MADAITGPVWAARNTAAGAGAGSIHDDKTASGLGFRGGTVAGSVHMNQFAPVLIEVFGYRWFEGGNLSLEFRNATVDGEEVQVFVSPLADGETQTEVWMERADGMRVCEGTAAMRDHSKSRLATKDLRECDPGELRILRSLSAGESLGSYEISVDKERQFKQFDEDLISDPLDFYRTGSIWGGPIACPSTIVQHLYRPPQAAFRERLGDVVGLFGAIEVGHVNGPLILGRDYRIEAEVVCVGQSPKTEYLWFDSKAIDGQGKTTATMRMQLRFMKASSPLYQDAS